MTQNYQNSFYTKLFESISFKIITDIATFFVKLTYIHNRFAFEEMYVLRYILIQIISRAESNTYELMKCGFRLILQGPMAAVHIRAGLNGQKRAELAVCDWPIT